MSLQNNDMWVNVSGVTGAEKQKPAKIAGFIDGETKN